MAQLSAIIGFISLLVIAVCVVNEVLFGGQKTQHDVFTTENPLFTTTNPDQLHHDERRNQYLTRLNHWYGKLSEAEQAEFDERHESRLALHSKNGPYNARASQ